MASRKKPGLCWEFGVGLWIGMVRPERLFRWERGILEEVGERIDTFT